MSGVDDYGEIGLVTNAILKLLSDLVLIDHGQLQTGSNQQITRLYTSANNNSYIITQYNTRHAMNIHVLRKNSNTAALQHNTTQHQQTHIPIHFEQFHRMYSE
jgi:hypothetical protein